MLVRLGAVPLVDLTPCMHKLMPALLQFRKDQSLREITQVLKVRLRNAHLRQRRYEMDLMRSGLPLTHGL